MLEVLGAAGFAVGDADAGGEAAQGVGDGGGEVRDVVEGEDPVLSGEVRRWVAERGVGVSGQ